ncbi:MAG: hypothetical protein KJZ83_00760 [Burkholderiaceae bacterium]|nr:hypothetical protein [Burkholderiaceae bacterium]
MGDATLTRYGQLAMRTRALLDALDLDWNDQGDDPVLRAAVDLLAETERKLSLYVSAMPSAGSTPPSRDELRDLWFDAGVLDAIQSPATDI